MLPYAQPIGKIAALKTTAIQARPDGLYLYLRSVPALLPAQAADTFWEYVQHRPNQQTTITNSPWLFPRNLPGKHTHREGMLQRLRSWDINLNGVRNTTLRDLARQLNPTALADSLGYSGQIIHQDAAAVPKSDYVDLKAAHLKSSPQPNTREE